MELTVSCWCWKDAFHCHYDYLFQFLMTTFSDEKGLKLRAQIYAKSVSVKLCCFRTVTGTTSKRNNRPWGDVNSYRTSVLKLQGKRMIGRYRFRRNRSTHLNRKDIGVDGLRMGTVVNKITRCPTLVSNVNCVRALCCRHREGERRGTVTCRQ